MSFDDLFFFEMSTHFNLHQFHSSRTVLAKTGLGVNRLAALGLGWVHPTVRFKYGLKTVTRIENSYLSVIESG